MTLEELQKLIGEMQTQLTAQQEQTAKLVKESTDLKTQHQQQMSELLKQVTPKPEQPKVDYNQLDLNTPEGMKAFEENLLSKIAGLRNEEVEGKLKSLEDGFIQTRANQFLNVAEQELKLPAQKILEHPKWNEFLEKSTMPVTNKTYKQMFDEANNTGDVASMTNLVKLFASTDGAREAYKEITGQDMTPAQVPSGGANHGQQTFEEDEAVKQAYKAVEDSVYGEGKTFEDFLTEINS